MNMSTSSLILYRTFQVLGFILAIFKIFAPFIALYLLWRIARNLEKPPKLTEEVKIVRKSLSEMLKEHRPRCKMTDVYKRQRQCGCWRWRCGPLPGKSTTATR